MKKSMILLVVVIAWLLPGGASAASYTFDINSGLKASTPGTDTNGLDHHLAYAWNLSGFNLGTQTITGASITFTNIHNWDSNANKLFIYIAASSASTPGTTGGGTGSAACSLGACGSLSGDVTNNNTGFGNILNHTTYYTDSTNGTTINDEWAGSNGDTDPLYSTSVGTGAKSTTGGRTKVGEWSWPLSPDTTQTYNFTTGAGSQVADLQTYIGSAAGGDFALLMDSDCHYFFDDITFTLTTTSPVPEPGSILLLITVLAGSCLILRRKKTATLA
jgi:hypothetical protein